MTDRIEEERQRISTAEAMRRTGWSRSYLTSLLYARSDLEKEVKSMSTMAPGDLALLVADPTFDIDILLSGVLVQHPDFVSGYRVGLERYLSAYEDGHDASPWTSQGVTRIISETWSKQSEHAESWRAGLIFGWICAHLQVRERRRQEERNAS
jgi:hypothetical protein